MTIGVKLIVPVTVEPYDTSTLTLISGYLNIWYPEPVEVKFTNLPLSKSDVLVPPIPASASLKVSSLILLTI